MSTAPRTCFRLGETGEGKYVEGCAVADLSQCYPRIDGFVSITWKQSTKQPFNGYYEGRAMA